MAKQRIENVELRKVRAEINRLDGYYSGQWSVMSEKFKVQILDKLKVAKLKELELMKTLGYV